jgi:acyl-coenzyme A thioesterase PaaI-like protein
VQIDFLNWLNKIPVDIVKYKLLDRALSIKIPFNRGLGLAIQTLNKSMCEVHSPARKRRHNHVGGAHACFLALMAEYPAGLLLAQHYPIDRHRLIIQELKMEYLKQGRGRLVAISRLADTPEAVQEEQLLPMVSEIFDGEGNTVARGTTLWQIKPWSKVRRRA